MIRRFLLLSWFAAVLPAQEAGESPEKVVKPEPAPARLVVLNKAAASASVLDPQTGEEMALFEVGDGPHEAATAPDGRRVVVCNYGTRAAGVTLSVLDVVTGKTLRTIRLIQNRETVRREDRSSIYPRPHGIRFVGPDLVAVTSEVRRVLLLVDISEESNPIQGYVETWAAGSHMVAVDDERAYVANISAGSVSVIDLKTKEFVKEIETGAGCEGIEVRPGTRELWTTNRAENTVSVIDLDKLEVAATLETGKFPIRVAFTPDGKTALISCAQSGTVELWDTEKREKRRSIEMNETPIEDAKGERLFAGQFDGSPVPVGILIRPDGKEAFIANTQADIITVIDLEKERIARRLKTRAEPDGMTWVPAREGG